MRAVLDNFFITFLLPSKLPTPRVILGTKTYYIKNRNKIKKPRKLRRLSKFSNFIPIITPAPFILFPSAITNSLAVLLLPSVAKDQAEGRKGSIAASMSLSLRYSLYMGILCIGIFTLFGEELGTSVFQDPDAGRFIRILAWLCPFLYLATTMGSILNGLGKTRITFIQNTISLLLRIGFVLFGIPYFGILAYLWGMLISEILLALLHLWSLKKMIAFTWNAWDMIVKPVFLLMISVGIFYFTNSLYPFSGSLPMFFETAIQILFLCFCYGGLLLVFHFARKGADQFARCWNHAIKKETEAMGVTK